MVAGDGLMRVFWPSDAPRGVNTGVLVGWRNSEYDYLVIAILQDVEVSPYSSRRRCMLTLSSLVEWTTPFKWEYSSVKALILSNTSSSDAAILHRRFSEQSILVLNPQISIQPRL